MANKPNILCILKEGMALAAAPHLRETWNWVTAWCANLKAGDGLAWENRESDHPTLKVQIVAGDGISVTKEGGAYKISVVDDDEDDDSSNSSDPGNGTRGSGGGDGGDGGNTSDAGGDSALGTGDSGSGGGSSTGGGGGGSSTGGGGGGSSDSGTSCNKWSEEPVEPGDSDAGMDNYGDNCKLVNGW